MKLILFIKETPSTVPFHDVPVEFGVDLSRNVADCIREVVKRDQFMMFENTTASVLLSIVFGF